jgi:hypothetical protein
MSRPIGIQRPRPQPEEAAQIDRMIKYGIIGGAALLVLVVLFAGGSAARIMALVIAAAVLQGLWRGAAELVGIVAGTLAAVMIGPMMGRGLEGVCSGLFRTTGLTNRFLSIGIVSLAIIIVVAAGVSVGAKRFLEKKPELARWNPFAGAALGLIEGLILAMAVLWVPLALEPVARAQVDRAAAAEREGESATPNPVAQGLIGFATGVRESSLGGLAESTNPIQGSRILSVANDFAAVMHDQEAMRWLLETDVMRSIHELPSVVQATEMFKADPNLSRLADEGAGSGGEALLAVMNSPTVLRIFDQTSVVRDITPRGQEMAAAIAEAKTHIGGGGGGRGPG